MIFLSSLSPVDVTELVGDAGSLSLAVLLGILSLLYKGEVNFFTNCSMGAYLFTNYPTQLDKLLRRYLSPHELYN
jgi:UDP-N-acetylmuramyl pentapeptide phosphotransferase/UDP-N-acetylglucosamine-1-phosphate transferase